MSAQQTHDYGHFTEKGPVSSGRQELARVIPIRAGIGEVALGGEVVVDQGSGGERSRTTHRAPTMSAAPYSHAYNERVKELRGQDDYSSEDEASEGDAEPLHNRG